MCKQHTHSSHMACFFLASRLTIVSLDVYCINSKSIIVTTVQHIAYGTTCTNYNVLENFVHLLEACACVTVSNLHALSMYSGFCYHATFIATYVPCRRSCDSECSFELLCVLSVSFSGSLVIICVS